MDAVVKRKKEMNGRGDRERHREIEREMKAGSRLERRWVV